MAEDTDGGLDFKQQGFLCSALAALEDDDEPLKLAPNKDPGGKELQMSGHEGSNSQKGTSSVAQGKARKKDSTLRGSGSRKVAWTPNEDYAICELFHSNGPKWTMIAKLLPGRSVKAVKNRCHLLRRKMETLLSLVPSQASCLANSAVKANKAVAAMDVEQMAATVDCILSLRNMKAPSSNWRYHYDTTFGPFHEAPADGALCDRCKLLVPSTQTGKLLCNKTNWCQACTDTPPFVVGTELRRLHERVGEKITSYRNLPDGSGITVRES